MDTNSYKAQFCRLYFSQLKCFIKKFDVKRNNLGMLFLTEIDNREYRWDNSVFMSDKNLMAAIEEYFHITDSNSALQDKRETLLKGLIYPDNYAIEQTVKDVFVEEVTLRSILTYFGIKEEQKIDDQIKAFKGFAEDIACEELSFAPYNQALYLFKSNRNDQAHNIIKQEVYQRKIAFQFLIFTYIGLVYLLRTAWYEKEDKLLTKYKKPENFSIPEQSLHIVVNRKDSSNDNIIGYEFVPNIKKGNQRIKESIDPKDRLDIIVPIRKYDKFKIVIKYGTSDNKIVDVTFGDKGDTMLSYYYWNPTWVINLPSSSSIQPGLSLGEESTEELVTRLLENVNKQQEGAAKQKVTAIVNEVLCALEPTLQQIRILSENSQKSAADNVKLNNLIQKVNEALQNQIDKNEESFRKVLNRMDELKDNQTKEFQKLSEKAENHFKTLMEEAHNLSEQIEKEKEDTLQSDKARFWGRQWPNYVLVIAAIALFVYSWLFRDLSLSWLQNTWLWIATPIILLSLAGLWTWYVFRTTVSNKLSIIRPQTKWLSGALLVVAFIFTALAFNAIPNKTIQSLAVNYDFFAPHNEGDNAKAAKLMEYYLDKEKPIDDENLRMQIAKYYLHFADNKEKVYYIIKPMIDNPKKYKRGFLSIAETLYLLGDYNRAKRFIDKSQDREPAYDRIEGLMYIFSHGYEQDIMKGESLLRHAAENGDVEALYWMGYIYSHDLRKKRKAYNNGERIYRIETTKYDLISAINYYRQAFSRSYPSAAIELGNIYADLNMSDSAKYYYKSAIRLSREGSDLWKEANYRMGIFLEYRGEKSNSYLGNVEGIYPPAILYVALRDKDYTAAIEYYKELGRYEGYRYIPPIVFEYVKRNDTSQNDMDNALDTLIRTRPKGKFNRAFLNGMEAMLSKDSVTISKGFQYMEESASQGCLYASMLCTFLELYDLVKNPDRANSALPFINLKLNEMLSIADEIPFSYVLAAWISREMGDRNIRVSDKLAQMAIRAGHPAGLLILSYYPKNIGKEEIDKFQYRDKYGDLIYRKQWTKNDILDLIERRNILEMLLRINAGHWIFKSYSIMQGIDVDRILTAIENKYGGYWLTSDSIKQDYSAERLHFWGDIAMTGHDNDAELRILDVYRQLIEKQNNPEFDMSYRKKLITAALADVYFDEETAKRGIAIERSQFLYDQLSIMPSSFIDSLRKVYKGNSMISDVINNTSPTKYRSVPEGTPFSKAWFIDMVNEEGLLNEFWEITEGRLVVDRLEMKTDY